MKGRRKSTPRSATSKWLGTLALLALALLVYARAFGADWMWDDDANVTACAPVLAWNGLRTIWLDPHAIQQYYPVLHTTFWIEHKLWGLHPMGYHVVNVVLHALNAFLFWRLLRRLGIADRAAWIAGVLFVVHPVHVESVAWITEMKNTLSLAFALASASAWVRWAGLGDDGNDEGHIRLLLLSVLWFALSLLSKSVTISLPIVLAVLAWWKRGRWTRREWTLVPWLAASVAFSLLTIHLESENVGTTRLQLPLEPAQRVLLAGRALWFYATKLAFPVDLNFIYPRWSLQPSSFALWLYPVTAALALAALLFLRKQIGRGPAAAALAWGAMLAPMLGFIDIFFFRYSYASDHFQYHASLAPLAMAGLGLAWWGEKLDRHGKRASIVLLALVGSLLLLLTIQRVKVFHDSTSLWTDTLERNPRAWIAWNNLGRITLDAGRNEEAEAMLRRAIAIDDRQHEPWNNLGICLMSRGRSAEAVAAFERAIALHPTGLSHRENLGRALLLSGDAERAATVLQQVVAHPDHGPDAELDLGESLARSGKWMEAEVVARGAHRRFASDTRFALLLAAILRHQGNHAEALQVLEQAAAATGRADPVVLDALAVTLASDGRFDEAARVAGEGLALHAGPEADAVLGRHLEAFRRREVPR